MPILRNAITTAEDVQRFNSDRPGAPHPTTTVRAVVNHGRWIVPCPWCFGAEHASKSSPIFFCASCRNAAVDAHVLRVIWPDNPDDIEGALLMRPDPRNRNWTTESLSELLAENQANGVI